MILVHEINFTAKDGELQMTVRERTNGNVWCEVNRFMEEHHCTYHSHIQTDPLRDPGKIIGIFERWEIDVVEQPNTLPEMTTFGKVELYGDL